MSRTQDVRPGLRRRVQPVIRERLGGLIPYVTVSRTRHVVDGQTFRLWIVWLRISVAIEVGL
jgi:hypothetical protein